jgi:hypothetical protein
MRVNAAHASFGPMSECFKRYMYNTICKGDTTNCVSRCPHFC